MKSESSTFDSNTPSHLLFQVNKLFPAEPSASKQSLSPPALDLQISSFMTIHLSQLPRVPYSQENISSALLLFDIGSLITIDRTLPHLRTSATFPIINGTSKIFKFTRPLSVGSLHHESFTVFLQKATKPVHPFSSQLKYPKQLHIDEFFLTARDYTALQNSVLSHHPTTQKKNKRYPHQPKKNAGTFSSIANISTSELANPPVHQFAFYPRDVKWAGPGRRSQRPTARPVPWWNEGCGTIGPFRYGRRWADLSAMAGPPGQQALPLFYLNFHNSVQ